MGTNTKLFLINDVLVTSNQVVRTQMLYKVFITGISIHVISFDFQLRSN